VIAKSEFVKSTDSGGRSDQPNEPNLHDPNQKVLEKGKKADNMIRKGPKADQTAGHLLLRFTLVNFTWRGSECIKPFFQPRDEARREGVLKSG
jgi:hypothetical protein